VSLGKFADWRAVSEVQAELRSAMAEMPKGSRLAVIDLRAGRMPGHLPTCHAAAWAVLDREVLLSALFARPFGPFAVGFTPDALATARALRTTSGSSLVATPDALTPHFDYVAVFGESQDIERYLNGAPSLMQRGGAALLRLRT
jgi:hypothetical protein